MNVPGAARAALSLRCEFLRAEDLGVIALEMHLEFTAEHAGDDHSPAVPGNPGRSRPPMFSTAITRSPTSK